jgi:hypothetical protein
MKYNVVFQSLIQKRFRKSLMVVKRSHRPLIEEISDYSLGEISVPI